MGGHPPRHPLDAHQTLTVGAAGGRVGGHPPQHPPDARQTLTVRAAGRLVAQQTQHRLGAEREERVEVRRVVERGDLEHHPARLGRQRDAVLQVRHHVDGPLLVGHPAWRTTRITATACATHSNDALLDLFRSLFVVAPIARSSGSN